MDPTAALNILQNHARQKQAELAQTPPQNPAETSGPIDPNPGVRRSAAAARGGLYFRENN